MSAIAKLKAYKVWCDDPDSHGQSVRFAERGKDVSRYGNDCDCEFINKHVTRAPEFDKYAPGPVTIRQYLAEGWHYECSGCSRLVYEYDSPPIIGGAVYHSRQCVELHRERWREFDGREPGRLHESVERHMAAMDEWLSANPAEPLQASAG